MPISTVGGGGQQVSGLLKQVQNQMKPSAPGGQNFAHALANKSQVNQASSLDATPQITNIQKTQKVPTAVKSLFETLSKDSNAMRKITDVALSGQNFTPSQLIGLQQATYNVTFELETMSKLVEQASSAVKTTMQTPV